MTESKMPKVGYVVKCYPRFSETFVVNEILAHEKSGYEIEIFSLMPPEDGHFQDIIGEVKAPVHYLTQENQKAKSFWEFIHEINDLFPGIFQKIEFFRQEKFRHVYQALDLAKKIRLFGITHLHAHFASSATNVARMASHFANVPYTFTAHAKDIYHEDTDYDDLKIKIRDSSGVITVSDYNLQFFHNMFGHNTDKVKRVYNGMNLTKLNYREPRNRNPIILTVGRLVEKKGLEILIEACEILSHRGIDFNCRIIGQGELWEKLQKLIASKELQNKVSLLGALPRRDVIQNYYDAAVFAAPAIVGKDGNRDGLPTTLLEAMALGTPCISTDVTGIPEIIRDEQTGLLIRQNDPAYLAGALEKLLSMPQLSRKISLNARKLIESKFDIEKNSEEIRKIFSFSMIPNKIMIGRE